MKKIKQKIFWISVVAVAFLIADIPAIYAINLNIVNATHTDKISVDLGDYAKKEISVSSGEVGLKILNKENYFVKGALVYLCKDKNPTDCLKTENPLEFGGQVDATLKLNEVSSNGKAGLLTIVKISQDELRTKQDANLTATWDYIENGVVQATDQAEATIKTSVKIDDIKKFIKTYGMAPGNLADEIDFGGKSVHQSLGKKKDSTGKPAGVISIQDPKTLKKYEGGIDSYVFAFPEGQKIAAPLTIYNVTKVCGNGACELGETYQTCDDDCPCPEGQIAFLNRGCQPDTIKIAIDKINPSTPKCLDEDAVINIEGFSDCNPEKFDIDFHLENPPKRCVPTSFLTTITTELGKISDTTREMFCETKNYLGENGETGLLDITVNRQNGLYKNPLYYKNFPLCPTEYICEAYLPTLIGMSKENSIRPLKVGMFVEAKNEKGTFQVPAGAITDLNFKIEGVDEVSLKDEEEAEAEAKDEQKKINDIYEVVAAISAIFSTITIVGYVCTGIAEALRWTGIAEVVARACSKLAVDMSPSAIASTIASTAFYAILQICQGANAGTLGDIEATLVPPVAERFRPWVGAALGGYFASVFSSDPWIITGAALAGAGALYKFGFGGLSFGLISGEKAEDLAKKYGDTLAVPLAIVLGVSTAYLAWSSGGLSIGTVASGISALFLTYKFADMGDYCGKAAKRVDYWKQRISESFKGFREKREVIIKKAVSNLVWVSGKESGKKVKTVCDDEKAAGMAVFGGMCTDLWFSFGSSHRPVCDFSAGAWMNESDKRFFGDKCENKNTTFYYWLTEDVVKDDKGIIIKAYTSDEVSKLKENVRKAIEDYSKDIDYAKYNLRGAAPPSLEDYLKSKSASEDTIKAVKEVSGDKNTFHPKAIGARLYNETSVFTLFKADKAASLFNPPKTGSTLDVFISCDSQSLKEKRQQSFRIAEYKEVCEEKKDKGKDAGKDSGSGKLNIGKVEEEGVI